MNERELKMWSDRDLYQYDPDDYEEDEDRDDCGGCGLCDNCIAQSRAYAEQMEMEHALELDQKKLEALGAFGTPCDCREDAAKLHGGHKPDCPNAIPF
jgi:hypothetical protein